MAPLSNHGLYHEQGRDHGHGELEIQFGMGLSVDGEPILQPRAGCLVRMVKGLPGLIGMMIGSVVDVVVREMGEIQAVRMNMVGMVVVRMLERRLCEGNQEARNDPDMCIPPHESSVYTLRIGR